MTQAGHVGCRGVLRAMTGFHGRAVKGVMRKSLGLSVILVIWTRPRSVSILYSHANSPQKRHMATVNNVAANLPLGRATKIQLSADRLQEVKDRRLR